MHKTACKLIFSRIWVKQRESLCLINLKGIFLKVFSSFPLLFTYLNPDMCFPAILPACLPTIVLLLLTENCHCDGQDMNRSDLIRPISGGEMHWKTRKRRGEGLASAQYRRNWCLFQSCAYPCSQSKPFTVLPSPASLAKPSLWWAASLCSSPQVTTQPLLSVWSLEFTWFGGNQ